MKTNSDFILRQIADEYVLIPTGLSAQELNGMIHLTESAAFIWNQVNAASSLDEIAQKLQDEYEVDEETAFRDVYGFLMELYRRNIVQESSELEKLIQQVDQYREEADSSEG